MRRWQYLAQCVCARRYRSFTWWSLRVEKSSMFLKMCPAHRDEAEIKCMGLVGGKHQQNQKYIYSSLSLSIGSKTKLMGDKFMSVAFVRSDCSTLWKDNLSMYMSFSLYLPKD